jgi:predicted SPOUT superfamily RNA methylase MTH1
MAKAIKVAGQLFLYFGYRVRYCELHDLIDKQNKKGLRVAARKKEP